MKQWNVNDVRSLKCDIRLYFLSIAIGVSSTLCPQFVRANGLPKPALTKTASIKTSASISKFVYHVWHINPAIQSARSEVNKASAVYAQRRRPIYNPSVDVDVQHIRKDPQENTYTAGISQTIDLFHKGKAQASVGEQEYAEAKANLSAQKLSLAAETLIDLAKFRTAQEVVILAKRRTQLLRRFKQQTAHKFKSGDVAQDALDQAALAYAEAISQQVDEEMILIKAKQRLIAISQVSNKYWPRLPHQLPKPLRASYLAQHEWLKRLPVMQVYDAQVTHAQAQIRVAQTETRPDPTFSFRGGTEDQELLLGGGISMPLFVRNDYHDLVTAAIQQSTATQQTRMNIYQQAAAALQGNLVQYRTLYHATRQWKQASRHGLDGGMQLLNRLWAAGELSTTDYLVQLKQRVDSQIAGAKLKGEAWQAWFSLMKHSGQLNRWLSKKISKK